MSVKGGGAALAGAAVILGGATLAAALVSGGREETKPPATAVEQTEMAEPKAPLPPETGPETGPEGDALCLAHEALADAVTAIGTVDSPADLEATVTAQVAFHSAAADIEPEPDAGAFRSMAGYYDAVRMFYGSRGWEQRVDLADAALVPRPPADGAGTRTNEILAARCGIPLPTDTP